MNDAPQNGPIPPEQPTPPPGQAPAGWQAPPPGYTQQPWPAAPPPGWGYPTPFPPPPPTHQDSNTALIWGIVALFGGMSFCLPLLASPFALYYGRRVVREINESPQPLGGMSEAKAGYVMGLIGTILIGIAVALVLFFLALSASQRQV
ncbi:hypothetical protein ACLM5J_01985 [Nocardioides sp. Bht2]|uniref:hypothetical protein n=1 Tax=Nocardioides sp. Bht2 TaxID=3392297 RepID=UPI0039B41D59